MAKHVAEIALLAVGVASAVLSVLGVAVMRDAYDRLHYLAPVSLVGSLAVATAVVVKEALNARGIKALIVAAALAGLNPLLVHATARAARVRAHGDWRLGPGHDGGPRQGKRRGS
jgi:multisubunit Na+/H+ antiporter MnhG subunit